MLNSTFNSQLYHFARADFLDRTRRYSYLLVVGGVIWFGVYSIPDITANRVVLNLDGARGFLGASGRAR